MMDVQKLIAEAREWADGCADGGLKGNKREMDMANMFTLLADAIETLVKQNEDLPVETRTRRYVVGSKGKYVPGRLVLEQRRVGPWVEVPE